MTENTFDAYLYQLVENKQKFIAQIMTSKSPVRVADDIDETALSYSEIKALATGNPLIIEKCNLDMEVAKLNVLKASHLSQKYALEEMVLRKYPQMIQDLKQRIFCCCTPSLRMVSWGWHSWEKKSQIRRPQAKRSLISALP